MAIAARSSIGKARHRDAVRASHSHAVFRYAHNWIMLAFLFNSLAPPVLSSFRSGDFISRSERCKAEGRRHKKAAEKCKDSKLRFGHLNHQFGNFATQRARHPENQIANNCGGWNRTHSQPVLIQPAFLFSVVRRLSGAGTNVCKSTIPQRPTGPSNPSTLV